MGLQNLDMKRVAIIGAGGAGIISALVLKKMGFQCTVFETRETLGGLWNYDTNSPIYESLVTNLPRQIMKISKDYPFPQHLPSFIRREHMLQYLRDLSDEFHIEDDIYFSTRVTSVRPVTDDEHCQWQIEALNLDKNTTLTETFDACVVCNGHYDTPVFATVPGIEHFQGIQQHVRDYDNPAPYTDKTVVAIGASHSATDFTREVATTCQAIHVASRQKNTPVDNHGAIVLRHGISHVCPKGLVHFHDDQPPVQADVIVHCTGYEYHFDFLDNALVQIEQHQVKSLYKQIFHCQHPSLAFVGIPFDTVPYLMFYYQAQFIARIFSGDIALPEEQARYTSLAEESTFIHDFGWPPEKKHCLSKGLLWRYLGDLVQHAQLENTDEHLDIFQVYKGIHENIIGPDFTGSHDDYRKANFKVDYERYSWEKIPG